jgi:hypothetical protein
LLLVCAAAVWGHIAPHPNAPACPPEAHNATKFHTLWNADLGCHYDHEHGEPFPTWAMQVFGNYTQFTGAEISYPWQTPNENLLKHEGYKLYHKDLRQGYPYSSDYGSSDDPCPAFKGMPDITPDRRVQVLEVLPTQAKFKGMPDITPDRRKTPGSKTPGSRINRIVRVVAYSLQTHNLAHAHEAMTRKHSYLAMLLVCDPETKQFGTIITGGHADYGQRVSPYQGQLLSVNDQPQPAYNPAREPYLAHPCADCDEDRFSHKMNRKVANAATWTNEPVNVTSANKIVNFSFRIRNVYDGFQNRFTQPTSVFLCTLDGGHTFHQPGCYYVGTQHNFFQVRGWGVPSALASAGNRFVTFAGFTDLHGNVDASCTAASATCVPLRIHNAPVGPLMGDDQTKDFRIGSFDRSLFTERNMCFDAAGNQANCDAPGAIPAGWIGEKN